MSEKHEVVPRAKMSPAERRLRSRLAQLLSRRGVIRASLLERHRVCGKPNCRCTRGQEHESLYLVVSEGGRSRQLYVPKAWESRVRQWVADYQEARELLEAISGIHWDKLRQRRD